MKTLGRVKLTSRGFELMEFLDANNEPYTLQQSSLIKPHVWLGCTNNAPPQVDGFIVSPRMHLNRRQVRELVKRLNAWLEKGTFKA